MSDLEPFPELVESRRLDPNRINGVDQGRLTRATQIRARTSQVYAVAQLPLTCLSRRWS
jgi:hypothetical protein